MDQIKGKYQKGANKTNYTIITFYVSKLNISIKKAEIFWPDKMWRLNYMPSTRYAL